MATPTRPMKIHVRMPGSNHLPDSPDWMEHLSAPDFQRIAGRADELGYDTISTTEHFAMPYWELPRLGSYWMHGMTVMSFIAGATSTIRVDAAVLVLPYHHPLALAKAVSTLDVLSGGRVNLSVGVGHAEAEFASLGIPFNERGRRADEMLAAMTELWTAEEPVFHGDFFDIEGVAFEPKPVQHPRPPIYIGGNSKPALRRAARHDGWQPNPTDFSLADMPPLLDYLDEQPEYVQKAEDFDICWLGSPELWELSQFGQADATSLSAFHDKVLEWFDALRRCRVTRTSLPLPPTGSLDEYLDYLSWFASEIGPEG